MLHLIKYNLLVKLRNFNMVFWPLVFPLIMATFFFFAFGNLNDADFETVQVALVKESANPVFVFFLDQVQSGDSELIALHEMSEKDALDALSQKKISGIYYEQAIPGLTLNGQGIPIWNGMSVRFELGEEWNLRLMQQVEERKEDEDEQTV